MAAVAIGSALSVMPVGAAGANTPDPAIWVGSPVNGTWPNTDDCTGETFPSDLCSLPTVHHAVYPSTFDWGTGVGDWAADMQGVVKDQQVLLYAAPVNSGYAVSARVDDVGPSCKSKNLDDGGQKVTVGLYANDTKVGTVTYAHINTSLSTGDSVARWGGQIGTVGSYSEAQSNQCWKGKHVHVEMSSRHNYSCFSNIFVRYPAARISESNFIGFVGGSYASGVRQACA